MKLTHHHHALRPKSARSLRAPKNNFLQSKSSTVEVQIEADRFRYEVMKMAKNVDCCADCGAAAPSWASVNRGIFLCDDCGSIHRTLGRHVSIVKSLKRGTWPTTLLNLVKELHLSGSNEIWEHQLLLDPHSTLSPLSAPSGGGRKPMPNDSASKKQEFIQSKHRYLSFVQRVDKSSRSAQEALNEDLYNVVRTGAVKDSLRYVVLGADPNWVHPQKKMRSLHVASRSGQSSQVELLLLWGADPLSEDEHGQQAAELALAAGHEAIALRLQEAAFEVPDRLTSFITNGRRPDHALGIHFLEPELSDVSLANDDQRQARKLSQAGLKALGNEQLKNLSNDIHDEVDRRELDEQFASRISGGGHTTRHHIQHASATLSPHGSTPFLPVDPRFSSVRNQARQKLALLNAREFVWFIVDLLGEIRRRYGHQQAVELVKVSVKLLCRNSDGSQKDSLAGSNDFPASTTESKNYNVATFNRNGTISYGSVGRGGKIGARLRELPSTTMSSSDAYEDQNGDSVNISDPRVVTDAANADPNNTDADENEIPDYDDVEDAVDSIPPPPSIAVVEPNSVRSNVVDGNRPPLAIPRARGASSASSRVSGEQQLKSHSRHRTPGPHNTFETSAAMMAQLLDAISGLRDDFRKLSEKVDVIWEERCAAHFRSMPTQAAFSEATVDITRQIQALKQACENDDFLVAGVAETIFQHCVATKSAVLTLANSFSLLSSAGPLFENLKMNLENVCGHAAELLQVGSAFHEILVAARSSSNVAATDSERDSESDMRENIAGGKKTVMDTAYLVAKSLRCLHVAYGQAMLDVRSTNNRSGLCTEESQRTTMPAGDDGSHYAVIRPAAQ